MTQARFTKEARFEFLAQRSYYDAAEQGLGLRFVEAVEAAAQRAAVFPLHGKPAAKGTRRRRVAGFPFALFYTQIDEGVLIHAVAGDRQRPGYWVNRLPGTTKSIGEPRR